MEHYKLFFRGYLRDEKKQLLPHYTGIYCVYKCNQIGDSHVKLLELLYIGQSTDIHDRIINHDKSILFKEELGSNEQLCYTYAEVKEKDLDVVENGLIFMQTPKLNELLIDDFNHDDSYFLIEGKCALFKHTEYTITSDNEEN